MPHHSIFLDLALILIAAFATSVLFHRLHLPVIFGYILCGILLGPNLFPTISPIKNSQSVQSMSELGVIFLMFYVGIEFDPEKLKRILRPAFTVVSLQTFVLLFSGILIAPWLGWSSGSGLFLGAILAISSTMVAVTVLREQNHLNRNYGQLAIGILVFEDIIAILLLVLLSGFAASESLNLLGTLQTSFFVGLFVIIVYVLGRITIPPIVGVLHRIGKLELITLFALSMVLGMSLLAEKFHFSAALGAFLAGAVLSKSKLILQIEKNTEPLRDLFGAIFFVAVGMMVDPGAIGGALPIIVLLSLLKILFTAASCWVGLFLSNEPAPTAFRTAMVKSQVGEFSFIIATMGESLGVMDTGFMSITVGVAMLTMFTTPYLSRNADSIYSFIESRIPQRLLLFGEFQRNVQKRISRNLHESVPWRLLKRPLLQIFIYVFLLFGVLIVASLLSRYSESVALLEGWSFYPRILIWLLAAALSALLLMPVVRNIDAMVMIFMELAITSSSKNHVLAQGRFHNLTQYIILGIVLLLFSSLFFVAASNYLPKGYSLLGFVVVLSVIAVIFQRHWVKLNSKLELLFMESFNQESQVIEKEKETLVAETIAARYPWPIHIQDLLVRSNNLACGSNLVDLELRSRFGVNVIGLQRDDYVWYNPAPTIPLFPGDILWIAGEASQNKEALAYINTACKVASEIFSLNTKLKIYRILVTRDCLLVDDTLSGSNLRQKIGINILGLQRGQTPIINPSPSEIIREGDLLYATGSSDALTKMGGQLIDSE